jgi:hypothetical protein
MPSMAITVSAEFDPCTLIVYWPSTKGVTAVPGSSNARNGVLRIGVGMASRISRLATNCERLFTTSTIGDSPVTVIDSSRVPTWSSPLICAVKAPCNTTPSRRTVRNPVRLNTTS